MSLFYISFSETEKNKIITQKNVHKLIDKIAMS